ncbi:MAG: WD40 repeat domain-containing protein [Helicobacteraceae bacterium]|jgi:WD40 repeat protein|nr:WD40 repeat domain-containing protein [Helicobacteraceae bacterium]
MRTIIYIALIAALTGCASKESAIVETDLSMAVETPAPQVVWKARADKTIAEFGVSSLFSAVAFSREGDRILSGDWDKRVVLQESASGAITREFSGHADKVTAVAFGEDDAVVFSASADRTIRAWSVSSGKQIRLFSGHVKPIASIALSGQTLVSADVGGVIRVWNAKNGGLIRQISDGRGAINAVAITQNHIVRGGADGLIKIYDLQNGKLVKTLKGHKGQIYAIAAKNGEIFSGGADGTIRVWDLARFAQKKIFKAPAAIRAIAAENGLLASGGDDMIARFWDLARGEETHNFQTNAGGINAIAFKGDLIACASTKLQLFSAIDPNAIGFEEIARQADELALREYGGAISSDETIGRESFDEKRLAALEKALSIYWGDPRLSDLVYNEENQSVSGFLRSFYGDFSRKIEFEIAQDNAFELFYNPSYEPRAIFIIKDGALILREITIKDAWGEQTPVKIIDDAAGANGDENQ